MIRTIPQIGPPAFLRTTLAGIVKPQEIQHTARTSRYEADAPGACPAEEGKRIELAARWSPARPLLCALESSVKRRYVSESRKRNRLRDWDDGKALLYGL